MDFFFGACTSWNAKYIVPIADIVKIRNINENDIGKYKIQRCCWGTMLYVVATIGKMITDVDAATNGGDVVKMRFRERFSRYDS